MDYGLWIMGWHLWNHRPRQGVLLVREGDVLLEHRPAIHGDERGAGAPCRLWRRQVGAIPGSPQLSVLLLGFWGLGGSAQVQGCVGMCRGSEKCGGPRWNLLKLRA